MGKWSPSSLGLRCDFGPAGGSRPRGGGRPQSASHRVRGAQTSPSRYHRAVPPVGAEFRAYGCGSTRRRMGAGGQGSVAIPGSREGGSDGTGRVGNGTRTGAAHRCHPSSGERAPSSAVCRRRPTPAWMPARRPGMTTRRTPTRTLEAPPIGQAPVRQDHVAQRFGLWLCTPPGCGFRSCCAP